MIAAKVAVPNNQIGILPMTDFTLHTMDSAPQSAKELLSGVQKNFKFLPLMFRYMSEAPVVLNSTLTLLDLISKTSLTPAQQQVALLAASVENECANCITAHRVLGNLVEANPQTLDTIYARSKVSDPKDDALATFTQSVVRNRGRQTDADADAFLAAGFTKEQIFEVILIAAFKTLTNYSNHLTNSPADEEMLAMLPS